MDIIRNNTLLRLSKADILSLVRDALDNDPHYVINSINTEQGGENVIDVCAVKNVNWNENIDRQCIDIYIEENY
jgi:hypothetical protein